MNNPSEIVADYTSFRFIVKLNCTNSYGVYLKANFPIDTLVVFIHYVQRSVSYKFHGVLLQQNNYQ